MEPGFHDAYCQYCWYSIYEALHKDVVEEWRVFFFDKEKNSSLQRLIAEEVIMRANRLTLRGRLRPYDPANDPWAPINAAPNAPFGA